MAGNGVLELAAQIVSAHVSRNAVNSVDLPKLIVDVHRALVGAGQPTEPPRGEPAVPIRQSVKPDHLVCLECGSHFSTLKRHLATDHQLTAAEYREKWGLPRDYPIVAAEYAKRRSALAKKIGLGTKPGDAPKRKAGRKAR
jgi:predicted transcriptional regulator